MRSAALGGPLPPSARARPAAAAAAAATHGENAALPIGAKNDSKIFACALALRHWHAHEGSEACAAF